MNYGSTYKSFAREPEFRPRVALAQLMIRIGVLFERLALMVMRTEDLVEFGRRHYLNPDVIRVWSDKDFVSSGLDGNEKLLLKDMPVNDARVLVLGVGGGREAIALARMGGKVTGVDFIEEMVLRARQNAARAGVDLDLQLQELSEFHVEPNSFDIVWISAGMYSSIPTRQKRVSLLKSIREALAPGGHFLCQFFLFPDSGSPCRLDKIAKVFAYLTLGYIGHENGDRLLSNREFAHLFSKEADLCSEFKEGGLEFVRFVGSPGQSPTGAILRKSGNNFRNGVGQ